MIKSKILFAFFIVFFAQTASAQVLISEIQISPIGNRFIELYNPGTTDVDMTGWYIQRKTTSGSAFGSLVSSTQMKSKIIRANSYFLISRSQLENSDVVAGDMTLTTSNTIRIRDSKGVDVDQVEWGTIADGMSYQKLSSGVWGIAAPTPGAANASSASTETQPINSNSVVENGNTSVSTQTVSIYPVEPQIFTDAGPVSLTVSTGATITFVGKAWGLKKEPLENARMVWAFGDGGTGEGTSVAHTFYYPGEYTVVLDTSSGYYSASDRVRVTAVTPVVVVRAGGDNARSFVTLQNSGNEELDLSLWQIEVSGKKFIIPKNTFVGAKKTLTFAGEMTGLVAPVGSLVKLNFPNGTQVDGVTAVSQSNTVVQIQNNPPVKTAPTVVASQKTIKAQNNQGASIADAFTSSSSSTPQQENDMWLWYTSVALLGVSALLGLRFVQKKGETKTTFTADDFKITEDSEDIPDDEFDENEPH